METKPYTDKNGRDIELKSDDPEENIKAFYNNREIGEFIFNLIEDEDEVNSVLLVTNMYLEKMPGFKRCGIGTAIVDWVEEYSGYKVVFDSNEGTRNERGSHLTGDGPEFARYIKTRSV